MTRALPPRVFIFSPLQSEAARGANSSSLRVARTAFYRICRRAAPLLALPLLLLVAIPVARADDTPTAAADEASDAVPADQQDLILLGPLRPLVLRLHITVDKTPFRTYWRDRVEESFAEVDTDRDGRITPEEAAKLVGMIGGPASGAGGEAFGDLAKDGTPITLPIVVAHVEKFAPPIVVREEPGVSGTAIFSILDADGDRRLSLAELRGAEQLLRRRDFNDDEVITADELLEDPRAKAAIDPVAGARASSSAGAVVLLDRIATAENAAGEGDAVSAALAAHYDRNGDGRLATRGDAPELNLDSLTLAQLTVDSAGNIDPDALADLCRRHVDLKLHLGLGSSGAVARWSTAEDVAGEIKIRRRLSGAMKIEGRGVDIELTRNKRNPARDADQEYSFASFDKDSNDYLDEAESKALPPVAGTFAAMDANQDGKVFKAEFTEYLQRKARAANGRLLIKVLDRGQDLFDLLDALPDNQLSVREIISAPQLLSTADRNGDGYLAGEEIAQRLDIELSRAAAEIADRLGAPGRLVPRAAKPAEQPAGPEWFVAMDRNQDGDVSRREFLGTPEVFARFDADKNGLIDADEAAAAER